MSAPPAPSPRIAILVLFGPTGTGKSEIALDTARQLGAEIVGCDALQVYRGLDAATAKPNLAARASVRHHLVDCIHPRTDYSMADYVRAADRAIAAVRSRGHVPLVVGGTGLYLRGLLRGFLDAPARDSALRERLCEIVERGGMLKLRALLRRIDPESERRIAAADVQRTIRALELARAGSSWSARLREDGTWSAGAERYRALKIGLDLDRERHRERLDSRVDHFFSAGLVAEVETLLAQGLSPRANALKAIGYREVLRALLRGEDPAGVREEVKRNTRRYAKRQRSWFRGEAGVVWLDAAAQRASIVGRIVELWRRHAVDAA